MKKLLILFSFYQLLSMLGHATNPTDFEFEKKSTTVKNYTLQGDETVVIKNTFGRVNVTTWDKNEVKIIITIYVSSNDQSIAETVFNQISIKESIGKTISLDTKIGGNGTKNNSTKKNTNSKMEINYEIQLPSNTPLTIENSFGNTTIDNRTGLTNVHQSFGNLTVGNLKQAGNINVEFGNLSAKSIDAKKVQSSYSNVKINEIEGFFKGNFEFCSALELSISKTLESLNINSSYSKLLLSLPEYFNGSFDIKTSFSDLKNKSPYKIIDETADKTGPVFDKVYKGNCGDGKSKIVIRDDFGKITIQ